MNASWSIYIVECGDGSFYTGVANDVTERVAIHNQGKGAKYTRSHLPVKLVYTEVCLDRSTALKREHQIKKLTRPQKKLLIQQKSLKRLKD